MAKNSSDNSYGRFNELKDISNYYRNNQKNMVSIRAFKKIRKIDKVCNVLSDPYKTIIKKTFFEVNDLYWWVDYYSRTTYYRLRSKAIKTFLAFYKYGEK